MRGTRYFSPFWGLAAMLLGLLVLGLIVAVAVLATRLYRSTRQPATMGGQRPPGLGYPAAGPQAAGRGGPGAPATPPGLRPDALAILDERLARGDIDVGDYEARRRALLGDQGSGPVTEGPESP